MPPLGPLLFFVAGAVGQAALGSSPGIWLMRLRLVSKSEGDVTFKQAEGEYGLYHLDIGVSYGFPGLPPRTANSGVGTVRIVLPGASFPSSCSISTASAG